MLVCFKIAILISEEVGETRGEMPPGRALPLSVLNTKNTNLTNQVQAGVTRQLICL